MPENISSDTSDIVPAAYSDNNDYSCAICTQVYVNINVLTAA